MDRGYLNLFPKYIHIGSYYQIKNYMKVFKKCNPIRA